MRPPRKRAQTIAQGRGRDHRVVIPLAFEVAARISARPPDAFRNDPTQLANGLTELQGAIAADGIVCALAGGMEFASAAGRPLSEDSVCGSGAVAASLEACARLRQTVGDDAALLAGITGPATLARQFSTADAGAAFTAVVRRFCEAGADAVLVIEDDDAVFGDDWTSALRTADNVARFHQAALMVWNDSPFGAPVRAPLDAPRADGVGFITTDAPVPADTDIEVLRAWVAATRAA